MSEANNKNDITFFAETNFRNQKKKFGIKTADRRKHMYVIGKTGMGKTTLLENMAIQDISSGRGLGIVDPHGEFAEKMLNFVPKERIDDVVYFNPADTNFPVAFNPMEEVSESHRHLVASGLLGVFKKIWPDVWSPRMEYLLSNSILALLEIPGSTLLGINRMFSEKEFRKSIVARLTDPVVKAFWEKEYAQYQERFATEASAAIQNKVGQFISNPLIRNIIGQTESAFDIRKMMDDGKILVMNLSKGKIGEENSRLLGAMLVTKIYLTAMTRVDIPKEEDRRDFYLYVDEFQNFATESFASILSEARKYRLNLTLAHQYVAQMDEKVSDAVFGNVGSMVAFRVGAQDAELLEKEYSPEFTLQDLVNLGFAQIYLKLMIDGVASRPFSASTLAPFPASDKSHKEEIAARSQEKYGMKQAEVKESIEAYFGVAKKDAEAISAVPSGEVHASVSSDSGRTVFSEKREEAVEKPKKRLFEAHCVVDGKVVLVPFEPDGRRPVYCQEHLELLRSGVVLKPEKLYPPPAVERQRVPVPVLREGRDAVGSTRPTFNEARTTERSGGDDGFRPPRSERPVVSRAEPGRRTSPEPGRRIESRPVVRAPSFDRTLSLSELPKKDFARKLETKKEINIPDLRSALEDSIKKREEEKVLQPQVSGSRTADEEKTSGGVIKPGQTIRF